jgi:hypothetical protein
MATDNRHRYGFRWVGSFSGKSQPEVVRVPIASAYAPTAGGTAIGLHVGDPIQILGTGYGAICVGSEGTQSQIYGIIESFGPIWDGSAMSRSDHFTSGGGVYGTNFARQTFMNVIPVVDQKFAIDVDDKVTATTYAGYLAMYGGNTDMVLVADTTNAADPKADPKLDISLINTTALQWRIIELEQNVYQDYGGSNVSLVVTCNKVQQAPYQTTGV